MLASANYLATGYAWPEGFERLLKNRERRLFNSNMLGDVLHFRPMKRNSDDIDEDIGFVLNFFNDLCDTYLMPHMSHRLRYKEP